MTRFYQCDKPSIYIYCTSKVEKFEYFNDILWGIEEEELPFFVKYIENLNSQELSHRASKESRLGIGIGVDKEGIICLTTNKLLKDEPLYILNISKNKENVRAIGTNSARLVKGLPLKLFRSE
ncbi:glycerol dehydratase reactivase beta/small subunit family protein [Clostridium tarantellae]|uniref:Glycerol dehydratase n=1 Tax=Clostridium tarantellae TaxID=39493 RepID=A0A6I1MR34_9CLOT|nr:glycerol dehydratase reactivase beta/small subunit family protein [Clostridium tarantellae]MPQ43351.1 glycerol dehydratase [Clostridium tarantellae]